MPNPPSRRPPKDPRKAAEAMFRAPARGPDLPAAAPALPGARELVSLRIDRDVLEHFQKDGPGWQERLNAFLRTALPV